MKLAIFALLVACATATRFNLGTNGYVYEFFSLGSSGTEIFYWNLKFSGDFTYGTSFTGGHTANVKHYWQQGFDIYPFFYLLSDMDFLYGYFNWKVKFMFWPFYIAPFILRFTHSAEFDPLWVCIKAFRNTFFGKFRTKVYANMSECRSSIWDMIDGAGRTDPLPFVTAQCSSSNVIYYTEGADWLNSGSWELDDNISDFFESLGIDWLYGADDYFTICSDDTYESEA